MAWNNKRYDVRNCIDRKLLKTISNTDTIRMNEVGRFDKVLIRNTAAITLWQKYAMLNELSSIDDVSQNETVYIIPLLIVGRTDFV